MAKSKVNKVEMIVIGDAKECGGCKSQKEFMRKNAKKLADAGITDIRFLSPNTAEGERYQNQFLGGIKAQPLTVIKRDEGDTGFVGFSSGKFIKSVRKGVKAAKKGKFVGNLFK